ncbi:uncharacterized protein LOC115255512 [Aedes albopictus]|uniref:Zinc finger PHD-type domain-containing protein n=1 Tax=Aedes albopictus TaxID=7160 RepID=A0ABM1YRP4_AEDAL
MSTYKYPCCDEGEEYDASVLCEKCREWYHFECVGVDDSVAEVVWYCGTCLGEDRSIRASLGAPGNTTISPMVFRHPSRTRGRAVIGKSGQPSQGRMTREPAQDDDENGIEEMHCQVGDQGQTEEVDKRVTEEEEEVDDENDLLRALSEAVGRYCNRVKRSESVPVKNNNRSNEKVNKSTSVPSAESTRTRALRELQELEEWNRLEELEEVNQRKLLELERKRIARQKEVLQKRMELRQIVSEDFVFIDKDFPELVGDAEVGVEEGQSQELLKNTGTSEIRSNTRPPKLQRTVLSTSTSRHLGKFPGVSNYNLPRPSFENRINARSSICEHFSGEKREAGNNQAAHGPSHLQIASRQVFPRSLPKFSGAAEEWPIFISAYEQANTSCGFTNAENLVRLQEALTGKALETVRNRLLLPENVPLIVEKLRKRFGNPEILSTRLANRIQGLEGPSAESLESVIEFGSAVEEFTQHLKAAGLVDRLKNPILMQSLVQKLPSYYAMEWVEYKRRAQSVDLETFGTFMECLVEKALEATFEKADMNENDKKRGKAKAKSVLYAADGDNDGTSGRPSQNDDEARRPEQPVQPQYKDRLELPSQRVNAEEFVHCDHLYDVEIPGYDLATPQVLLGIDNLHLVAPLESRTGDPGEPVAIRSLLGWTVYGPRPRE